MQNHALYMRRRPKKWAVLFFCLLLLLPAFSVGVSAVPEAPNLPDHSHAQAVIVYNADQKVVLFEKNADKVLFPASTVKIMTGFLASELLSPRMDETVTITEEMLEDVSGNRMRLSVGETICIRDLFFGAVCGGYNDACTALAVLAAGSTEAFVSRMNEKAATLGMTDTVYKNPTGLHVASMVTTARDTLKLSLAASTDERYMEAASAVKHEIPETNMSAERSFYNRNYLIASAVTTAYHNPYAEGLNGGMTSEGGWCVAAKAYRFDLTWFCIVLGGEEDPESGTIYSYEIANNLLSWAARGYELRKVVTAGEEFTKIPLRFAAVPDEAKDGLPLVAKDDLSVFVPKNTAEGEAGLEYTVRLHSASLEAPFEKGSEAGVLIVTWNGEEVGRVALITETGASRNEFTFLLSQMKELPKNRTFMAALISFIVLTTVYFMRVSRFRYRRRLRGNVYIPAPFRRGDEEAASTEEAAPPRTDKPPRQSDPYAGAARELERREKTKNNERKRG